MLMVVVRGKGEIGGVFEELKSSSYLSITIHGKRKETKIRIE
jgi:hypothetical protein